MNIDEAIKDFQLDIERIRFHAKDPHYSGDNWSDSFTMTIERDWLAIDALKELKRSINMTERIKMTLSDLVQKSDLDCRELFDLIEMCYRDMLKRNPKIFEFEDPNSKYYATIDDIRKFARDNHGEIEIR